MIPTYSDEAVRMVNENLGGGHRVKPYDLTSDADLKDALLVTVAAYRDYWHYRGTLDLLAEYYDESLEYCETAAWLDLSQAPDRVDTLIAEGREVLNDASDVFYSLTERAREKLTGVVKVIVTAPKATQVAVFGREYKIEPQEIDSAIDNLFLMLGEAEYHQSMPDNLDTFLEVMSEVWEPYLCK